MKTTARAKDLHERLNINMFEEAYANGMNFTALLEKEDPSSDYHDGLNSFERQLEMAKIRTRGDRYGGYGASLFDEFLKTDATRALAVEWVATVFRQAKLKIDRGGVKELVRVLSADSVYGSDDYAINTAFRPYIDSARERIDQIAPAIPISELVAATTPINGNTYRSIYLTPDDTQLHFVRVGETAEIPAVKMTHGAKSIDLYKFGRRIIQSYEVLRRTPIDVVARHIAWLAVQAEVDKLSLVLDVMVNGDGNGNAAPVDDSTILDSASTTTLTFKAWVAWLMQFDNPYQMNVLLARKSNMINLMLLPVSTTGNMPLVAVAPAVGLGGFTPINRSIDQTVRYGTTEDAPATGYVGMDSRFGIERVTEIGSDITEVARFIRNQTQDLVMSEVEGYAKNDPKAVRILDVS